jgi:FMN-dependent NADH-azoreductase
MTTLLRIDSGARIDGSHSRQLADYFQARWAEAHPGGHATVRDLARDPVPHLDNASIVAFHDAQSPDAPTGTKATTLSDALIAELESADDVLIASPLYNLALPSVLKAYFDHVVRSGRTFSMNGNGYHGLLSGKSVFVVAARGGSASPGAADDFQIPYLRAILSSSGSLRWR